MTSFTGYSTNGVPYARISDSGPALVVFTGSELEHQPPSSMAQRGFMVGLKRLVKGYTVYLMSRKPHLPHGYTAQQMSDDFAEMIRCDIGRPVHILGMSSGGSSAMHFAVDHADLVNKLVLAMTAHELNAYGRQVAGIWRDLALAGDRPALYQRMGIDVAEGSTPEWVTRLMMRLFGKLLLGTPKSGSDFAIVLDSDINLDVADKLPVFASPPSSSAVKKTPFTERMPFARPPISSRGAELCLLKNGGHAVVKTQTRSFETAILEVSSRPILNLAPVLRWNAKEKTA